MDKIFGSWSWWPWSQQQDVSTTTTSMSSPSSPFHRNSATVTAAATNIFMSSSSSSPFTAATAATTSSSTTTMTNIIHTFAATSNSSATTQPFVVSTATTIAAALSSFIQNDMLGNVSNSYTGINSSSPSTLMESSMLAATMDPFGNESLFDSSDFTEDELLFRMIWSNATGSSENSFDLLLERNGTDNGTYNSGNIDYENTWHLMKTIAIALILGFIILATVIGNVFVIAAILLERNLQSVANYLILSLAVADLLVACLVMPLSAVYEVSQEWKLGPELCDMWTSSDVLCCTASILHLVAIALDRYWAVTNIDYVHHRTAGRIGIMILVVWALSLLVSIAPLFGWKDPKWYERVVVELECLVSQDIGYQVFATASSFYVPLLVILVLYWRIFQTARKRIRRRQQVSGAPSSSGGLIASAAGGSGGIAAAVITVIGRPLPTISETTTAFTNVSSANTSPEKNSYGNGVERSGIDNDPPTADNISMAYPSHATPIVKSTIQRKKAQNSADSKRERKAAKTLAIITGAFVFCWLPFFIIAILLPACSTCQISPVLISIFLWLGYFNSTLNPIIYTIFSPEFRHAFKRILCGRKNSIRRRTGVMRR